MEYLKRTYFTFPSVTPPPTKGNRWNLRFCYTHMWHFGYDKIVQAHKYAICFLKLVYIYVLINLLFYLLSCTQNKPFCPSLTKLCVECTLLCMFLYLVERVITISTHIWHFCTFDNLYIVLRLIVLVCQLILDIMVLLIICKKYKICPCFLAFEWNFKTPDHYPIISVWSIIDAFCSPLLTG